MRNGYAIVVTYAGWILPGTTEAISWDVIEKYELAEGMFADVLKIKHSKGHDPKQRKLNYPARKYAMNSCKSVIITGNVIKSCVISNAWQRNRLGRDMRGQDDRGRG